jgi:hypothetical protein
MNKEQGIMNKEVVQEHSVYIPAGFSIYTSKFNTPCSLFDIHLDVLFF